MSEDARSEHADTEHADTQHADTQRARIDWEALRVAAREASTHAYAPYSEVKVGAAALTTDGRIVTGCNVENASYGVGMCAECILVGNLALAGGGTLIAFDCVDSTGETLMPCGRCRQLLAEHAAPGMLLHTDHGLLTIDEVMPHAFGSRQLAKFADTSLRRDGNRSRDHERES